MIFVKVNYFRADGEAIQSPTGDKLIIFNSEYLRIKNASFDAYAKKRCPNPDSVFSNMTTTLSYPRNPSIAPAATAEPITPATFGPMACMSR